MANIARTNFDGRSTQVLLSEVRFSYSHVFAPRMNDDGTVGKYGVAVLLPKTNTEAQKAVAFAVEEARKAGVASKWNGTNPPKAKLSFVLKDGDVDHPDDETYKGMWYINTASQSKPEVKVRENGMYADAFTEDDFYSGCYGAVVINFYPFAASANKGIAPGLQAVYKLRDGEKLGGNKSTAGAVEDALADLDAEDPLS